MPLDSAKKDRLNITVSTLTQEMIASLRASTDADSDSEVIRNCVRLAFAIEAASRAGSKVTIESPSGEKTALAINPVLPIGDAA